MFYFIRTELLAAEKHTAYSGLFQVHIPALIAVHVKWDSFSGFSILPGRWCIVGCLKLGRNFLITVIFAYIILWVISYILLLASIFLSLSLPSHIKSTVATQLLNKLGSIYETFGINFQHLHVCTVHQLRLKHFIIQQMDKYTIRRYK